MKKVVKQAIGIDISKDKFYACYKVLNEDGSISIKGTKSFDNNDAGYKAFYLWCKKRNKTPEALAVYVMEATGVYYENLAYFLYDQGEQVSVQLASKLKHFAKSSDFRTKTDKEDSKMIAEFGIEKNLTKKKLWSPPSEDFKMIRDLAREHTSLKSAQSAAKSQLHALNYAHKVYPEVIKMKKSQIAFYEKQFNRVEKELRKLVGSDEKLQSKMDKIETIKGLGFITIIKVLSEVNGFLLFTNIAQLISYSGLDVIDAESGTHTGKTKISKKGNERIRTALYLPAMSALQHNKDLKIFYDRVNEGRTIKKQGVVAVMRKLLILIYTLWKKDEEYIENYQAMASVNKKQMALGNDEG